MTPFMALLRRDLTLAWRQGGTLGTVLGFYLVVVALMPLGLGSDPRCCRAWPPAFFGSD